MQTHRIYPKPNVALSRYLALSRKPNSSMAVAPVPSLIPGLYAVGFGVRGDGVIGRWRSSCCVGKASCVFLLVQ
jgi:hypothetical protein